MAMDKEELVSYEEAEMLAQLSWFDEKCKHYYKVGDKEAKEADTSRNFNLQKTWMGVKGWKWSYYSAPTKSQAILWLINALDDQRIIYENLMHNPKDQTMKTKDSQEWLEKQEEKKPVNVDYISEIRKELLNIEDNAERVVGLTESQWVAIRAAHRLLGEYIAKEQPADKVEPKFKVE